MPRALSKETLDSLCDLARLELPQERRELIASTVEMLYGLADSLDAIVLGEAAPATAFDARWE